MITWHRITALFENEKQGGSAAGGYSLSIEYSESLEEAARIARAALPLANQLGVPVNPVNYTVLYQYVARQNAPLREALDRMRESRADVGDAQIQSLYRDFIAGADEQALEDAGTALSSIVDSTRGLLDRASRESRLYQDNLDEAAGLLAGGESTNVVDVIAHLVEETLRMQAASQALQDELARANADLNIMRDEFNRVREESMVDPLTGVKNRRAFDAALAEAHAHVVNSGEPLCLLMVDIDHFKAVNDTYGHLVGDEVLKRTSGIINDTVRGGDVLARYGGEEFVVLLPDTTMEGAEHVADNICTRMRNQPMNRQNVGRDVGRVTVSVGATGYVPGEPMEVFVERADTALYRAKQSGRNRVVALEAG